MMKLLVVYLLSTSMLDQPEVSTIAHAGGGIQGSTYTNSFEAMNYNYSKGFELFELDFSWTSDNHLVCLHDWKTTPVWLLNYTQEKPVSLAYFQALDEKRTEVTLCDLTSLNDWLKAHPKAYVVTDIKTMNIAGLKMMVEVIEDAQLRLIPQFSQPANYPKIKALGFKSIIWSLYQFQGNKKQVTETAAKMDLFAVAIPPHKAKNGLAQKLKSLRIPTYVHTINDRKQALNFIQEHGVTSVYTDFLEADFVSDNDTTTESDFTHE